MIERISSDEQARQAVLSRFGITAESKDYNLDRIVRVAALGMGCEYGIFTLFESGQQVRISTFGETIARLPSTLRAADAVRESGEPLEVNDLSTVDADLHWADHDNWPQQGAFACRPVIAAATVVIGALTVISTKAQGIDSPENRRIMLDCVRLLEDSLTMRRDSIRDPLTGLYNRRFFEGQITAEWQRAKRLNLPVSILVIDIDHFKSYNDSLGHLAGDRALARVADILKQQVRRSGDTICRYGGEEFAMILSSTALGDAEVLANRVRKAVSSEQIEYPGLEPEQQRTLTISVGVSVADFGNDSEQMEPKNVLGLADSALYEAKAAGRNCVRTRSP